MSYRFKSGSAWTGRFPRSTEQRWPSHPVRPYVGIFRRFYCFPVGGSYFEAASACAVIEFLIRNKYVH